MTDNQDKSAAEAELSPQERFFRETRNQCLLNDDYMRAFFHLDALKENRCLCATYILRILTGISLEVKSVVCQADLQAPEGGHGVRFDVLAIDRNGIPYDIEFQRLGSLKDIALRAYYNRSMLAVRSLEAGGSYKKIRRHYVIFITEKDLCRRGRALYRVGDPPIIDTDITLKFPGHILIANAAYRGDDELGRLMHDIRCTKLAEMHRSPLRTIAEKLKEPFADSEETENMGIFEEVENKGIEKGLKQGRQEGRIEGFEEGRLKTKIEEAHKMAGLLKAIMKERNWTAEETLQHYGLSGEDCLCLKPLL